MRVGVISDTHGFVDPALPQRLAGVELILHGGDVDSQLVLDELSEIAPVHAVRGNVDPAALGLPLSRKLRLGDAQIEMRHILPVGQSQLGIWMDEAAGGKRIGQCRESLLANFDPKTRVIIFGHSHQPCLAALDGALFFNPGSAGKKRFSLPRSYGLLEITQQGIRAAIYSLGEARQDLPPEVRLQL